MNSVDVNVQKSETEQNQAPTGIHVIWRELAKDKLALFSLILFIGVVLFIYIYSFLLDQSAVTTINLRNIFSPPNAENWLGTDYGGRDVFGQLVIGARNSLTIGIVITLVTSFIGITLGVIAGYFGGWVDYIIMRFIDFILVLPTTMLIIVFVSLVPRFNVVNFIFIMSFSSFALN